MKSLVGEVLAAGERGLRRIRNDTPVPYVPRRGGSFSSGLSIGATGDPSATLEAPGHNGTLFAIINRLSTSLGAVDWHMHKITNREGDVCPHCDEDDPGRYGVVPIDTHPALSVWRRPNDHFTTALLVETVQQHLDLVGEGFWVVGYLAGRPIELWPVRPDRMAPVRDAAKFIAGWVYRAPDGQMVPLKLNEVVPMRTPAPWDPYRGAGAAQTLLSQLYGAKYAAEWNARFFQNSAVPGGVVEMPVHLQQQEWDEFQLRWAESHKGVSNAHTVAVLEHGAKWIDVKYTHEDMAFTELSRATREETREAFGMHGHMLGLSESVNRANAEAAEVTYARWLVDPRAFRLKQALNGPFLRLFKGMADGFEFAYSGVIPGDREADNAERTSKTTAFKTLVDAGCDPAYAAEVCGLPVPKMAPKPKVDPQQPPPSGQEESTPADSLSRLFELTR